MVPHISNSAVLSYTNTYSVSTSEWVDAMIGPLALPFNVFARGKWTQHMGSVCLEALHSCAGQLATTVHECGCEPQEHISWNPSWTNPYLVLPLAGFQKASWVLHHHLQGKLDEKDNHLNQIRLKYFTSADFTTTAYAHVNTLLVFLPEPCRGSQKEGSWALASLTSY